jgi:hypothetical protein
MMLRLLSVMLSLLSVMDSLLMVVNSLLVVMSGLLVVMGSLFRALVLVVISSLMHVVCTLLMVMDGLLMVVASLLVVVYRLMMKMGRHQVMLTLSRRGRLLCEGRSGDSNRTRGKRAGNSKGDESSLDHVTLLLTKNDPLSSDSRHRTRQD